MLVVHRPHAQDDAGCDVNLALYCLLDLVAEPRGMQRVLARHDQYSNHLQGCSAHKGIDYWPLTPPDPARELLLQMRTAATSRRA